MSKSPDKNATATTQLCLKSPDEDCGVGRRLSHF